MTVGLIVVAVYAPLVADVLSVSEVIPVNADIFALDVPVNSAISFAFL